MRRRHLLLVAGGLAVAGAGVAYAATVGLTSKRLTVLSADAPTTTTSSSTTSSTTTTTLPAPKASALTVRDGGGTTGLAQAGDTITVTYSDTMSAVSFCSSWTSGDTADYSITGAGVVTVTLQDNATSDGKDRLVVAVTSAACGGNFNFGSINLVDSGFVTSASGATFTGGIASGTTASKIEWTHASKQLKITLGTRASGTVAAVNGNRVAIHTPDTDLKGSNDVSISSDTVSSTPTNDRLF